MCCENFLTWVRFNNVWQSHAVHLTTGAMTVRALKGYEHVGAGQRADAGAIKAGQQPSWAVKSIWGKEAGNKGRHPTAERFGETWGQGRAGQNSAGQGGEEREALLV